VALQGEKKWKSSHCGGRRGGGRWGGWSRWRIGRGIFGAKERSDEGRGNSHRVKGRGVLEVRRLGV